MNYYEAKGVEAASLWLHISLKWIRYDLIRKMCWKFIWQHSWKKLVVPMLRLFHCEERVDLFIPEKDEDGSIQESYFWKENMYYRRLWCIQLRPELHTKLRFVCEKLEGEWFNHDSVCLFCKSNGKMVEIVGKTLFYTLFKFS